MCGVMVGILAAASGPVLRRCLRPTRDGGPAGSNFLSFLLGSGFLSPGWPGWRFRPLAFWPIGGLGGGEIRKGRRWSCNKIDYIAICKLYSASRVGL